jgi:hypothetical protein
MKTDKFSGFHNPTSRSTKNEENDTNGTSVMGANQNATNISGKRDILPTEKLIICEIVFCGLPNRNVNIGIEMPIAENIIRYQADSDIN